MDTKIFINLPVKDLDKSKTFFAMLGFGFDMRFTDENAACMVVSDTIYVMLLKEPFFDTFMPAGRSIADARRTNEVMTALSFESRDEVDRIMQMALANGGHEVRETQDMGFMYGRSFADPDGHIWEPMWMDRTQMVAAAAD